MAGGKGKSHGGKAGGKSGSAGDGKAQQSHSAKAGLQFPCGRVKRFLKNNTQHKMRVGAKGELSHFVVLAVLLDDVELCLDVVVIDVVPSSSE